MREREVEAYLHDRVCALGGMCPKFQDVTARGAPDRLVMVAGHPTYFVELKRPKEGCVSPHQVRYHERIRQAGQSVFILRSKEEVDMFMERFK